MLDKILLQLIEKNLSERKSLAKSHSYQSDYSQGAINGYMNALREIREEITSYNEIVK